MLQLKTDSLTLTTGDITKVLTDVIHENTKDSLNELGQKQADILQGIRDALSKLQDKTSKSVADILAAKSAAVAEVETSKRAAITEIQTCTKRLKSDTIREVEERQEQCIDDIKEIAKSTIAAIEDHSTEVTGSDKKRTDDEYDEIMHCKYK